MNIEIRKITDLALLREICSDMIGKPSKITLDAIYDMEHSPIRSQMFQIKMIGIPSFVSTHFVRHKIGVEHFVVSNREDRGGEPDANRYTPVNHTMLCNAQAILAMARERLCFKASRETRNTMEMITNAMYSIDTALYARMVPKCVYRGGRCYERPTCGKIEYMWKKYGNKTTPTASVKEIWEK